MTPLKPLGVISPTDQTGLIVILTAVSLSFIVVSFLIRIYIRAPKRLWKWDDNVLTIATALSIIQTSLVFYEVHLGFGRQKTLRGDSSNDNLVKKYYFANDLFYLAVLLFSKLAVCFLFLRLTRQWSHLRAIYTIIGLCCGWFLLSVLLISIGSSWERVFSVPFGRWLAVGVTDSITEVIFVLFTTFLVSDLHMSAIQKGKVIFAFALRLLAVPACAIRLYYLDASTLPKNRSLAISLATVCTQIQLGYGIMAASITVLKPFMVVYEKPLGYTDYTNQAAKRYATDKSDPTSFKMQPSASSGEITAEGFELPTPGGNADQPTFSTRNPAIYNKKRNRASRDDSGDSIHSQNSRRMIIERKTDWSIRYEDAGSHEGHASESAGSV